MSFSVTSDIYKTIFETLVSESDGGELDYITTFQSRFYPVRREMEYNALYPYVFLSFSGISDEDLHSMPQMYEYTSTISVVILTWNEGDVNVQTDTEDLNQDAGFTDLESKGVLEVVEDVKRVIYNTHKANRFGYSEGEKRIAMSADINWSFGTVESPTVTSLQPLLLSPYIEAKQLNINLIIREGRL